MTVQDLIDLGCEDFVIFEDPSYDGCIVGISYDNRPIYSLSAMVEWMMNENDLSYEDALDFINYNTLGALGCTENCPIVMDDL